MKFISNVLALKRVLAMDGSERRREEKKYYNHLNATAARFMRVLLLYARPYVPQLRNTFFPFREEEFPFNTVKGDHKAFIV